MAGRHISLNYVAAWAPRFHVSTPGPVSRHCVRRLDQFVDGRADVAEISGRFFLKKAGWSVILCIPFFEWLFYGAFYTPLNENDVRAESNPNVTGDARS